VLSLAIAWLDGGSIPTTASGDAVNVSEGGMDGNSSSSSNSSSGSSSGSHTSTPVANAISLLLTLHDRITREGVVTSSNEILEDVPTTNLELLGVEYHLGRAYLMLPQTTPDDSDSHISGRQPQSAIDRRRNVKIAIEYYFAFLKGLERLGENMLENETLVEYHRLLDNNDVDDNDDDVDNNMNGNMNDNQLPRRSMNNRSKSTNPALMREMKIRHYQRKKAIEKRKQQYQSQLQRRSRLKLSDDEILDGYDSENLVRAYHIETLRYYAENSLEEISSSLLELEMLQLSIRMSSCSNNNGNGNDSRMVKQQQQRAVTTASTTQQQQPQQQPLQMTQIVKNPLNGELVLLPKHAVGGQLLTTNTTTNTTSITTRTDIANTIFRPSWNLPTMTLQQLGDIEYANAIQRAEQQRIVESQSMYQPRRYDQLVRDGMEDDSNLVEQSAKLDRDWDDWKDENPKGCGNKMSERGDRNF
jgi:hypothetical protein